MRYDAVVLGGGHHATIIAPYLARAGMSVGVFERGGRFGGAAMSGKGPLTGFRMNLYSSWTRFYLHPAYRDFDLYANGLKKAFGEHRFSAPRPWGVPDPLEALMSEDRIIQPAPPGSAWNPATWWTPTWW